jgi:DNA-directed RNA polymerase subunit RPC12/RpoP
MQAIVNGIRWVQREEHASRKSGESETSVEVEEFPRQLPVDSIEAARGCQCTSCGSQGSFMMRVSIAVQMNLTSQLLSSLPLPPDSAQRTQELRTALKESFVMAQTMMDEYIQIAKN